MEKWTNKRANEWTSNKKKTPTCSMKRMPLGKKSASKNDFYLHKTQIIRELWAEVCLSTAIIYNLTSPFCCDTHSRRHWTMSLFNFHFGFIKFICSGFLQSIFFCSLFRFHFPTCNWNLSLSIFVLLAEVTLFVPSHGVCLVREIHLIWKTMAPNSAK